MSTPFDRTSDRVVDAFLEEGPIRMSDRLFDAIVDDVYRTRQWGVTAPWRSFLMQRPAMTVAVVVVAIALAGVGVSLNRPRDGGLGTQPSPVAATPAPAIGVSLPPPGTILRVDPFTEPFTFQMPLFPDQTTTPVSGNAIDEFGNPVSGSTTAYRLFSTVWGGVTFHDDVPLAADMCRPSGSSIDDVPATPAAVGGWLESSVGLVVTAPVAMTVDGREAIRWDVTTGATCDTDARRPVPWFAAGERHRIYAIPTGTDTILVITWGTEWSNGSEEYLDQVNAATDDLVRSMRFGT
jgi:hypothetical protein